MAFPYPKKSKFRHVSEESRPGNFQEKAVPVGERYSVQTAQGFKFVMCNQATALGARFENSGWVKPRPRLPALS